MERDEVLQRLRAWTTGNDPASGEPLPLIHALRHTEVHATLTAALGLLEAHAAAPRPRNAGRAWHDDEDARLVALFDQGLAIARLAGELERTRGSITARLVKLGKIEPPPGTRMRY
jgi:hypothetical protein